MDLWKFFVKKWASNEISTLLSDYTTSDNVHLYKGQHVQVTQRSNDFCIVQLLNNASLGGDPSSPVTIAPGAANASFTGSQKQFIEVQVPTSLIKCRVKSSNDDSQSNPTNDTDDANKAAAAAAAKRKGSFKKWLRASHRKFTSNSSKSSIANGNSKTSSNSDIENVGKIKVLSNSEDLKMKNWLPLEAHNEDQEDELNEQGTLINTTSSAATTFSNRDSSSTSGIGVSNDNSNSANPNSHLLANTTGNTTTNSSLNNTADEDVEDMIGSSIPPPMNVIKAENSEQSSSSSFNKISNQSIDIQRELKLWQTKMESSQKGSTDSATAAAAAVLLGGENASQQSIHRNISTGSATELVTPSDNQTLNDSLTTLQESKSAMAESKPPESKLTYAIKELLNTEKDYVNDLAILVEKYMEAIKQKEVPLPPEMEDGKTKIVFGNIQQIYEWHKSTFCPELDKIPQEPTSYIGQLFVKYENRFQMYVKYCENKPKSEYIVSEYDTFFDELRVKLNQKLNIQDLLIKPVQRIMKYQLMLKEIKKYMEKEGQDCKSLNRAIEIMVTVPKNADDMMNVGRLQGFEGRITAQGRLLLQDTLNVYEPEDTKGKKDKQMKFKERRVFLFQQIIIFSEMIGSNKKFTSPHYVFKSDMKVNKLQLQKEDAQMSFTLVDKTPESNRKILCQCEDAAKYNMWIAHLQDLLDMQNKFLRDLQHPTLALKKSAGPSFGSSSPSERNSSHSGHSSSHASSIASSVNEFFKTAFFGSSSNSSNHSTSSPQGSPATAPILTSPASSTTSSSSSSTFKTSKSTPATHQHPATPTHANSFTLGQNYAAGNASTNGASGKSSADMDGLNVELASQLSLEAKKSSSSSSSSTGGNSSSIPNCAKVVSSYSAITEDEITVQQGDVVQIVTANMHNRFLVHREANEHQPAAEGWIPGHVLGFKSSNSGIQ